MLLGAEPSEAKLTALVRASQGTLNAFILGLKDRGFLRRRAKASVDLLLIIKTTRW
jgi:hypothetical protein